MSRSSGAVLLRIVLTSLLSIGLLVNGSAQAAAMLHAAVPAAVAVAATAPCHEEAATTAGDGVHASHMKHESGKPDCCKSAACDCACAHNVPAPSAMSDTGRREPGPAARVIAPASRYASPALPPSIRPPIV